MLQQVTPTAELSISEESVPLVVDLDGTLLRSDLLIDTGATHIGDRPNEIGAVFAALRRGKAELKQHLAERVAIDPATLPYEEAVLDLVRAAHAEGRPVWLASASHEHHVAAIAEHLGLFDGWLASDRSTNLSGAAKADRLVAEFGEKGFDYVGNDTPDLEVWTHSRKALLVRPSASLLARARKVADDVEVLDTAPIGRPRDWLKLLRVHQWAKNLLIFVPLATSHSFNLGSAGAALVAFFAFSLLASAIYVVNDLVDVAADRAHRSKCRRPLAAGTIGVLPALGVAAAFATTSFALAAAVNGALAGVLVGYFVLTTAYSFYLKRKLLIDVVALAMLYTVRVVAGAMAISVPLSEWLLGFSMFVFVSLALVKRYVELAARFDAGLPDPTNRRYRVSDLDVIAALAGGSAFNAVTVFALYASSPAVHEIYRHPFALWLVCPVLTYWLTRVLVLAHRREMDDDPIVFALKDRVSLVTFALIAVIVLFAKF